MPVSPFPTVVGTWSKRATIRSIYTALCRYTSGVVARRVAATCRACTSYDPDSDSVEDCEKFARLFAPLYYWLKLQDKGQSPSLPVAYDSLFCDGVPWRAPDNTEVEMVARFMAGRAPELSNVYTGEHSTWRYNKATQESLGLVD